MAKVNFILDKRRANKDGLFPVKLSITHNNTSTTVATGINCKQDQFLGYKKMVLEVNNQSDEDANIMLFELARKYDKALETLSEHCKFSTMSASDIRAFVEENKIREKPKPKEETLITVLSDYSSRCAAFKTAQTYDYTKKNLIAFYGSKIKFSDVTYRFLEDFKVHMRKQGLSINSQSIVFRCMRAVWRFAEKSKIIERGNNPFDDFVIESELREKEFMTKEQLYKLATIELDGCEKIARDFFMLQFYFCGIDPVDLYHLPKQHGEIVFKRQKIAPRHPLPTHIAIQPEAQRLIDEYQGKKKLLYFDEYYLDYYGWMHNAALDLRRVGDMIGYNRLHFRVARYTWATMAAELDVPELIIDAAMGHKPRTLLAQRYVSLQWKKIQEANRKVIDYIQSTPNFTVGAQ